MTLGAPASVADAPLERVGVDAGAPWLFRTLARLRLALIGLKARWRALIALLLGASAALALPPLYAIPILVPAFTGLTWLIDRRAASSRAALAFAWCFGFGFFLAGLYWVSNAFEVRGPAFAYAGPPAVIGLSALLACFVAFAALISRIPRLVGVGAVAAVAIAWAVAEWLREFVLTGFPWNLIGSVWAFSDAMIQVAAVVGTVGLSLLTALAAAMPATLADPGAPRRRAAVACGMSLAVLALIWFGGAIRLHLAGPTEFVDGVHLRLVQPNIPQEKKWRSDLREQFLADHVALSQTDLGGPEPTHVIWAETAVTFFVEGNLERQRQVASAAPDDGLVIVGALRDATPPVAESGGVRPMPDIRNSLHALTPDGTIVATFDKVHLVPFGEYVPLRRFLNLGKVTEGSVDITSGPGLVTLNLPGLPAVSPLICYEVIFPGKVVAPGQPRPDWLLNLTNDAWYGYSTGPFQHLVAARLRAVEEGLPLVRVANTGISAIIDAHGRIVDKLGLEVRGVLDGRLPTTIENPPPFARYGDLTLLGLMALLGVFATFNRP